MFQLDEFLFDFIGRYGPMIYLAVFLMIFSETGLFIVFLPGDSLIFACAAFAASGLLDIWIVVSLCMAAAFLGVMLNYFFGVRLGRRIYTKADGRFIKREHIDKANEFYKKHGGAAIIMSRFIPIVRQFTPFVAGIGKMAYKRFMLFNVLGVVLWVGMVSAAGYFFGNIQVVRDHFSAVLIAIVFVSLLPALIAYIRSKLKKPDTGEDR